MRPALSRRCKAFVACALLLPWTAQAQVNPFRSNRQGPSLSPEDTQLLFDRVDRLNRAEPAQVGQSETWSNPQTGSSGTSTLRRIFRSGGMTCHLLQNHVLVAGRPAGRDYRLTWCRTSAGEWKIRS